VGDRVIQLVNQPEDKVFNGDIGEIVQIFRASENEEKEEQIVVQFDEADVVYTRADYFNIMHAYCISIHKSQCSEFPIVILPVVRTYRRMLRKNLLYTAITRSKQSLIICGDMQAFMQGIQQTDTEQRYTSLQEKVIEAIYGDDADQIIETIDQQSKSVEKQEEHRQVDVTGESSTDLVLRKEVEPSNISLDPELEQMIQTMLEEEKAVKINYTPYDMMKSNE